MMDAVITITSAIPPSPQSSPPKEGEEVTRKSMVFSSPQKTLNAREGLEMASQAFYL
jgi:hypothetical protein